MAQANYVPIVFCRTITGVNRNASTKPFRSSGGRDLIALVAPPRNVELSRSGSGRDTARRPT